MNIDGGLRHVPMTDEELTATALPLLKELIGRRLLVGSIQQSSTGAWVSSTIIAVAANGLTLNLQLEDDAASIASATFL